MSSAEPRERAEAAFGHLQHAAQELIAAAHDALDLCEQVVASAGLGEVLDGISRLGQGLWTWPRPPGPPRPPEGAPPPGGSHEPDDMSQGNASDASGSPAAGGAAIPDVTAPPTGAAQSGGAGRPTGSIPDDEGEAEGPPRDRRRRSRPRGPVERISVR